MPKVHSELAFREYVRQEPVMNLFTEVMGSDRAKRYAGSVALVVANSNKLQECEPMSIVSAALQAATLQLSVDPALGYAYIVPYGKTATFVLGYRGMVELALRTGQYRVINTFEVWRGQQLVFDQITGHARIEGSIKDREVVGWGAHIEMVNGFTKTMYMSVEEIHDHAKEHSKSYNFKSSPWQTHPAVMERKTVLRQLLGKWGHMDPDALFAGAESDFEAPEGVLSMDEVVAEREAQPSRPADVVLTEMGFDANGASERPPDNPLAFLDAKLVEAVLEKPKLLEGRQEFFMEQYRNGLGDGLSWQDAVAFANKGLAEKIEAAK